MIKFGATYGLQLDPHDYVRGWMDQYIAPGDLRVLAPSQASVTQRGSNLVYLNYPPLPQPAINQLVIPTGATRWSHMLMLVTEAGKEAIYAETGGANPLVLEYRSEKRSEAEYTDETGTLIPADRKTLKMSMWALPPIPLTTRQVNSNRLSSGSLREGAYLIPLVDGRYWWQFRDVGTISTQSFANPTAMLTYLTGRVIEDVTIQTVHADYTLVPEILENDKENLGVVLDSVATQLGMTVVPDMTCAGHATATAGSKFALVNTAGSQVIHTDHLFGYGTLLGQAGGEEIGIPLPVQGDGFEDEPGAGAPASAEVSISGTAFETINAVAAGYSRPTVAGSSVVLRYRWDEDEETDVTTAMATRIAADYYARFRQQHDVAFVGIQQWQPTAYTDCVIHRQDILHGRSSAITRVRSIPFNLMPEMPLAGSSSSPGGSTDIMAFEIVSVNCAEGYVTTDLEHIERYTGGCDAPPGLEEDYELGAHYKIYDYWLIAGPALPEDLPGTRARAVYWADFQDGYCSFVWDLDILEYDGGC
jgi:hypothetical protein